MPKDTQTPEEFTVDSQKLRAALDKIHQKAQASSERSSALGQERKSAAEKLGCHKDALAIIERIDGMSEDKLGDFWRSFWPMIDAIRPELEERIKDMVDKMDAQTSDMEGDLE